MADPVFAALAASPGLRNDLRTVARLCQAILTIDDDDLEDLVCSRPRLELALSGLVDVAKLIDDARNIVVLTGAGVSVSCGIPDFRSKGGLYDAVLERFGLEDPQAIFDLEEFKMDPTLFYSFAKDVMPSNDLRPSPTHRFIAELEARGKLLRNYSQNIDGLERRAGVSEERVILCHGSFLTATCMRASCRASICGSEIAVEVAAGTVPLCRKCVHGKKRSSSKKKDDSDDDDGMDACSMGVLKPDIVFFGENLPKRVRDNLETDALRADLVLVLGTSLQVSPVARIPQYFHDQVPRILVNRELVTYDFDVELLGNCDSVVAELRKALSWDGSTPQRDDQVSEPVRRDLVKGAWESSPVTETADGSAALSKTKPDKLENTDSHPVAQFRPPRRFLFPGASNCVRENRGDLEPASNHVSLKVGHEAAMATTDQSGNEIGANRHGPPIGAHLASTRSGAIMKEDPTNRDGTCIGKVAIAPAASVAEMDGADGQVWNSGEEGTADLPLPNRVVIEKGIQDSHNAASELAKCNDSGDSTASGTGGFSTDAETTCAPSKKLKTSNTGYGENA
ncbi:unnamed protein product [Chondrus crispus]|uniref:Deacetylase sirtuin-type domain-containing protein n=1 Tax=Chondrus crispus TaxID=2769 RepID=R7QMB6_CHOCR|nr:unnamed protein product [Chondrus crispus]CDF39244.1 unnamed protein product [Chondrus crispus]|eukprot:XP_005719155.1 unnamed protein product [Chondrus crispus]